MATKSKFVDSHSAHSYDIPESIHEPEVFEWSTMMRRREFFHNKSCSLQVQQKDTQVYAE